ncbi:hypothetical protein Kpho01_61240 [Kitasatospora phosalacinea]|uniref:Pycsar effector protein domain-containing protein n=1 Tax=Kitasatospora phosalacinea TaxID=2065 RepID=A0A9W6PNM5_9ACTN|nr:hypothetical protein Kpho01_61240 [Kitasatospora phosalacinea]
MAEALTHTAADVGRTDQKAGVLLGLDGVLAAAVAILAQSAGARLAVIAPAAALLLAATILAVLVVRPRREVRTASDRKMLLLRWASDTSIAALVALAVAALITAAA